MNEDIVSYWRSFEPSIDGLHIHPHDSAWLKSKRSKTLLQQPLKSLDAYVASDRFGTQDRELHLSLLPVPFVGNLATANVIIFLQNPGLETGDYYLEQHPGFRKVALQNLRQERIKDYPFWSLNPEFAWSPAFRWWESKLRPVIRAVEQNRRLSYHEALSFVAKRVATVELFPYHSIDGAALGRLGKWQEMPSAVKAREYLTKVAGDQKMLKLVMRSHQFWLGDNQYSESTHFHSAPRTRGFTFNREIEGKAGEAGKRLMMHLLHC